MLGFAFWWAVRTGKRSNQAESLKERVDKVANVNEFNRREDEEVNRQVQNAGIILALCVLLGYVSGISGEELFPINARPITPKALVSPEATFVRCG